MNSNKQLSRLMVFSAVASKKSFTQAADYLKVSKSAVSQQMTQLEAELGVRLINRTTRGVSITPIGEKVLKRCLILQDQVDLLFNDLKSAGETPSGRMSVTYPYSLQSTVVLPAIEQLCQEFPGLEPELIADDETRDLIKNKIDVAIHVGELPDSSYRALPVGNLTEIFCATPLYLNRYGSIDGVEQLAEHRWIASSWQKPETKVTLLSDGVMDMVKLKQFSKANTLLTVLDMTMKHMGIALVPNVLAKPLIKSGELVHIAKGVTGPQWPIYTLHAYQQEKPLYITRFHQLVCRLMNDL